MEEDITSKRKLHMRILSLASTAAAALAIAFSGSAFAAPQDYRFELVRVTPAGPGKSDVTVRVVRAADGAPVTDAVIQATNADMAPGGMTAMTGKAVFVAAERPDHQRFRVETGMSGTWALHLTATVPSPPRTERTYFPANKTTLVRTVRGEREVVRGTITFGAQ